MKTSKRVVLGILIALGAAVFLRLLIGGNVVALLAPRGLIASQEVVVIAKTVLIMLAAAVPTIVVCFLFAWRYRADNPKTKYEPDRQAGPWTQVAMWAAPTSLVAVLWVVVWFSAHALDPYRPIRSSTPPMTIQVVALEWKWLFIYPEQGIATVNFVEFPENTPVRFELTADGPMSSFWIPQLGSQMYAMAAMKTELNLIAQPGEYAGRDTEINGIGYAGMTFTAKSVPKDDFDAWVRKVKDSSGPLDLGAYASLAAPSADVPPAYYAPVAEDLFDTIMLKYMKPPQAKPGTGMRGME